MIKGNIINIFSKILIILTVSVVVFLLAAIVLLLWRLNTTVLSEVKNESVVFQDESESSMIELRLPRTVLPMHYDLYIHPNVESGNFTGRTTITIRVLTPTDQIILHSHMLELDNIQIVDASNLKAKAFVRVKRFTLDLERQFVIIHLSEIIQPCVIRLFISFSGSMLGKMIGLYSSSYIKANGIRKSIAATKFEPTYARQAFPCFDEPNMKATFTITLVSPKKCGYNALSNMDVTKVKDIGEYNEVHFNKSVPMSTYFTSFVISDFIYNEKIINTTGIGEPFYLRAFASPENIEKVQLALEAGTAVLEYYIDYFQIEYPLPKMDIIAIPDFVSGAMENWGLVTFRETSLLYSENTTSSLNKQKIIGVIAHEFVHMWFGNLVTISWWNDLWLNEGFAKYFENKAVNALFPKWKYLDQYLVNILHTILKRDATLASHPIVQQVETPDQITEIFNGITYAKGSALVRMMEHFMKPEVFRKGLNKYLNTFKYKNTVSNDFLTVMDELVDFDLKLIMRTWLEQMGLPVVKVQQASNTSYILSQTRFLTNPNDRKVPHVETPFNYTWTIPITFLTSNNQEEHLVWFPYDKKQIVISLPSPVSWIKFNVNQIGYYRVQYTDKMWKDLNEALYSTPTIFTVSDRASLLDDVFALADAGDVSYETALYMTKYLHKELDYVPWRVASSKLLWLKRMLESTDTKENYVTYAQHLLRPIYDHLGWTPDANPDMHLKNLLRIVALRTVCSVGLQDCLNEAAIQFKTWLSNPEQRLHPDIRQIAYTYGMKQESNEDVWNQVWQIFLVEKDAGEKMQLVNSMASVRVPTILKRFLDLAWNETNVRGQDYFDVLAAIANNPIGESIVWEYVRENWQNIVNRFGLNHRRLGKMISEITSNFAKNSQIVEMQYFFQKYPDAGAGAGGRKVALEQIKNNIKWLEENRQKISNWLKLRKIH